MRCLLAVRQVPIGFRQKKSNAKNGNKRKNGRQYGVQNNNDGIVLRACRSGAGTLCITSGIHCSFHGTHHDSPLPFFEMVQAYHLLRHFSSRIFLPVKTLYHTTKNTPAIRAKIVESASVFCRLFARFPHFPILFSPILWSLLSDLPNFVSVGPFCPYPFFKMRPILNSQLQNPGFYRRKDGFL